MKMTRRNFARSLAAAGAGLALPSFGDARRQICAEMVYLGENMWGDGQRDEKRMATDAGVWRRVTARMAEKGLNMLLIDVGEGVRYPSHPELAIPQSWSAEKLQNEVRRLKGMGIEAIPKLNFSLGHSGWFTPYRQQPFSEAFYRAQADVIRDLSEIFDHPRFFHIGYDEERAGNQKKFRVAIARQGEAWWADFLRLVGVVEKCGMRTWMWSDYGWENDDFASRCPKGVVMSNWWYNQPGYALGGSPKQSRRANGCVRQFELLEKAGFDQIPCGSTWMMQTDPRAVRGENNDDCMSLLVNHCRSRIAPERLLGFLMAPWRSTIPRHEEAILHSIDVLSQAVS